ncbi:ice-binding family protein [Arthrobacter cryoconiti]|uniref:Ice-binding family protein n=1 Tax=Arthrobacter cryoconiti TaxID=748907 RepID=A0ABV8R4I2_9MICC|nr:ice-binding family protein [Arthrobacter cryoconiti]MCC9066777.1 DUF3494 domain-containing protein [Arthrobacter cryoconiti]
MISTESPGGTPAPQSQSWLSTLRRLPGFKVAIIAFFLVMLLSVGGIAAAQWQQSSTATIAVTAGAGGPHTSPVALGSAGSYLVLGGGGITSTGTTSVGGDIGVGPGSAIVGFPPGIVAGTTHTGDAAATQAQTDSLTAYNDAAARTPTAPNFAGDQNGKTLTPGVYHTAAAFALTGTLTLDAGGDPNAVFIFQVDAALNTAAASTIQLTNGAQANNVFWQVLGAAGTGASSTFAGTILAQGAITLGANTNITGRALTHTSAITLTTNTLTNPAAPVVSITGGATAPILGDQPRSLDSPRQLVPRLSWFIL